MRGGMPDIGFAERLQKNSYAGNNRREDILAEAQRYPLMNDLWEDKIAQFDKITVPAYVVASYSNTLHTAGTFRAWRRIASEGQMAAHPQHAGMARLLRRGERRGSAPLFRSLPQGREQRLGADAPRSLQRPRLRRRRPRRPGRRPIPAARSHVREVLPRRLARER